VYNFNTGYLIAVKPFVNLVVSSAKIFPVKKIILFLLLSIGTNIYSQSIYFPPLTGNSWDTISPSTLNWCQPRIDTLYDFLNTRHTDAFIILKDGKIVLEKYFGTFTADSIHYWASAGKSLTATLVGIAQENNLLNINDSVSHYLGTGWTSAPPAKEGLITVRNLLTMTSGLDDAPPLPCDNEDTAASCLLYLADAGTRWSYHTGAYKKLQAIVSTVSGQTYTGYTNSALGAHIGMTGLWYDGVYYSKPRSMARFGLLTLNKGAWANDTLMHDTAYYNAMTNTSQSLNLSYGYLWWLNGKSSFMAPTLQFVFPGPLLSNSPADMFCALGKNDQKIYVVPSQNMVVIRMGDAAYSTSAALTVFDNELWGKIDSLDFCPTGFNAITQNEIVSIYPNPILSTLTVQLKQNEKSQLRILSVDGREVFVKEIFPGNEKINLERLKPGMYTIEIINSKLNYQSGVIKTG